MDYDDVIERAAQTIYEADDPWASAWPWPMQGHPNSNPDAYRRIARAAAPILMEYGARLMREAAATHVCGLIARHAKDGCVGATADSIGGIIEALDPATIVKEAVK